MFTKQGIYAFICRISNSGAEGRYSYFNEVYQRGAYPSSELNCTKEGGLPKAFIALNEFDSSGRNTNRVQTAGLFVSFISELSRYYLLSRFDKKEVDSKKYVDYDGSEEKFKEWIFRFGNVTENDIE